MATSRALFALLVLLAAALSGCASDDAPADGGSDAEGDADAQDGATPSTATPTPASPTQSAASPEERIPSAFERIDNAPAHFRATIERYDGSLSRPENGTDVLYVDSANGTTYYRFGGSADERVGQVGKVVVHYSGNGTVIAARDESIANFTTVANFSALALGAKLPNAVAYYPTAQYMFLQRAHYTPSFAAPGVEKDPSGPGRSQLTWGQPGAGTGAVAVLEDGTERLFWLNTTVASGGKVVKYANVTFVYGADAAVDEEAAKMRREATMAFVDVQRLDADRAQANVTNATTWTVLGEGAPVVALAQAELRVFDMGDAGEETPRLALPLSRGNASNADVALAYVDADGDGKVSAGDTISFTVTRARQDVYDYDLRLTDTTTGWELAAR